MPSLTENLNELLNRERGELELIVSVIRDLKESDPDVVEGGVDLLRTASWSCSGLCHRIILPGDTPTVESEDLSGELDGLDSTRAKLAYLCESQEKHRQAVRAVLKRSDLDVVTRQFLDDLVRAHDEAIAWCGGKLHAWVPDK